MNDAHEAVISLPLRGPAGQAREVDAVVDTGYTGHLALLLGHNVNIDVESGGSVVIQAKQ